MKSSMTLSETQWDEYNPFEIPNGRKKNISV